MQDKSRFTSLMAGIGEFYDQTIPQFEIDFYWVVLKSFELKDVQKAFKLHIYNRDANDHFPSLPELLRFIAGDHQTKAEQAWLVVEGAFRKEARFEGLLFTDPMTQRVLEEMDGWMTPRAFLLPDIHHYESEFKKLYLHFLDNSQNKVEDFE